MAEKEEKEIKKEETKEQPKAKREEHKEKEKETKKPQQKKDERTSIVRLSGKDVNGSLPLERALDQVRGIGSSLAHSLVYAIETKLNIPKSSNLGSLSEQQIESIEELLKNPHHYGVPKYLLNRQKDMETGKDIHLLSNELLFATRQDVSKDMAIRTWRGHRHQYGQKVRGQRTRSTGRTGTTVGVMKKAELAKQAPATAGGGAGKPEAKKEEKKAA
jgi:small subunit ribosomal protein S13